jgi:hypothetical protein
MLPPLAGAVFETIARSDDAFYWGTELIGVLSVADLQSATALIQVAAHNLHAAARSIKNDKGRS